MDGWYSPTKATPDVFARCSQNCGHMKNWMDPNVSYNSDHYIGIIAQQKGKDFSEYIQTKLSEKLVAGKFYRVKFDVYWPKNSDGIPSGLEILLTNSKISSKKEKYISASHVVTSTFSFDSLQKGVWETVEYEFKATGQESFLTIGKFNHSSSLKMVGASNYNYCYYFIDNVDMYPFEYNYAKNSVVIGPNVISSFEYLDDVTESHLPGNCTCWNCKILNGEVAKETSKLEELTNFELEKGLRVDLNKVIFDYQNGEMLASSNSELNRLLFILEEQPKAELRFVIYTYEQNDKGKSIAKESALSIYHYLKNKGLKNSFSYIHAVKESLSQDDGLPRDRNIEMFVVNNN